MIDSDYACLQSLSGCNFNAVAWIVELTFSNVVVKCETVWWRPGHGIACGEQTHFSVFVSPAEKRARLATVRGVAL